MRAIIWPNSKTHKTGHFTHSLTQKSSSPGDHRTASSTQAITAICLVINGVSQKHNTAIFAQKKSWPRIHETRLFLCAGFAVAHSIPVDLINGSKFTETLYLATTVFRAGFLWWVSGYVGRNFADFTPASKKRRYLIIDLIADPLT